MLSDMCYGLRVELDDRDESVGKKIREATMQKIPYQIIVGDKEMKAKKSQSAPGGGKDLGVMSLKKFVERLVMEIEKKNDINRKLVSLRVHPKQSMRVDCHALRCIRLAMTGKPIFDKLIKPVIIHASS